MTRIAEVEKAARQARSNASTMRRQLRQLQRSSGPRYVVWYWLQGGRHGAIRMQIHCQTDDLAHAQAERRIAGAQPCCGGRKHVYIHDRAAHS